MTTSKRNYSLDTLKVLCCISVIVQHCNFVCTWVNGRVYTIISIAVPLFFMISGYFNTDETSLQKYRNRMKRIGKILFCSLFLYLLLYYFTDRFFHTSLLKLPGSGDVWRCIVFNDFDNIGRGHNWYLSAYLYVIVFFAVLKKWNLIKMFKFLPALFILQIIIILNTNQFHKYSNFLLVGIPCYAFGMLVRKYGEYITISIQRVLVVISFSITMFIALGNTVPIVTSACQWVLTLSIFVCFATTNQYKSNLLSKIGEHYILYIYVFHMAVIDLFFSTDLSKKYFYHLSFVAPIIMFLFTLIVSVVYKYCYDRLELLIINRQIMKTK